MQILVVKTKEDFERVLKEKPDKIIFEGEIGNALVKNLKTKKNIKKASGVAIGIGVAAAIAGIVAAPFTGGTSAVAGVAAFTATTAGGATLAISTAELVIIVTGALLALGISSVLFNEVIKNYDLVNVTKDGAEFKRKN